MVGKVIKSILGEDFNYKAILDDYDITKEIGEGGFGKVYLGKHKEKGKDVAIKYMDISHNSKTDYYKK
jgi:serine/threonine protein kinase